MSIFSRRVVFRAMESPWFVRAVARMRGPACATILMHRFITPDRHIGRHDPLALRQLLTSLRAAGIAFVPLEEAVRYCEPGETHRARLAVSFTVDDGYADFAEAAWPVFQEFECPVSLFVVPDVVAGKTWFWWDKLDWLLRHAPAPELQLEAARRRFRATWSNEASRILAQEQLAEFCKQLPMDELDRLIFQLAEAWSLAVPEHAPSEYRTLSWPQLRTLEQQGVRVGPHTMTHPVLGRCSDERASDEIVHSVQSLKEQLVNALPVFCYPNGTTHDQGPREWRTVESTSLRYSLTTSRGLMRPSVGASGMDHWRYRLPRIGYTEQAGRIIREFLA